MNAEFPQSPLETVERKKVFTIGCKFKGCEHKINYRFRVNEKGEKVDIQKQGEQIEIYHSIKAHLSGKVDRIVGNTTKIAESQFLRQPSLPLSNSTISTVPSPLVNVLREVVNYTSDFEVESSDDEDVIEVSREEAKINTQSSMHEKSRSKQIRYQLGLSKNFKACTTNEDKFYSLTAKKLIRSLSEFETSSDFYDNFFTLLNAEFPHSTLICSIENNTISIKC